MRDPKRHDNAFLLKLHKAADEPRKERERHEAEGPVFRRKAKDTERESSIRFWNMWN